MARTVAILTAVIFFTATVSFQLAAARGDPTPDRSLEERLLEDLGTDAVDDEVHQELMAPEEKKPDGGPSDAGEAESSATDAKDLNRQLLKELGSAGLSEDDNPLLAVASQMRQVEGLIGRADCGAQTQDLQKRIVAQLEELLKQARQCSNAGASSAANPQQTASRQPVDQPQQQKPPGEGRTPAATPASESEAKHGSSQPHRPTVEEMRELVKSVWGELPPGQREQMLQLSIEEFLPKYELLIEAYFKRLAEESESPQPSVISSQRASPE